MKVMFFNTIYYPYSVGGAEKSVQLLAEELYQQGHTPIVVCSAEEDKMEIINGVKVYYVAHRNVYWFQNSKKESGIKRLSWHAKDIYNPSMADKLSEIILKENPDIAHTNNIGGLSAAPWVLCKKYKIPVVHTIRDYNLLCPKSTMFKSGKNCINRCFECKSLTSLKRFLVNNNYVSHVVGISQAVIDTHKKHGYFKNTPSTRIFNGIKLKNVSEKQNALNEIGTVKKELKFLYLGRLEKTKGVELILEVFNYLCQEYNCQLLLGGRVNDEEIATKIESKYYHPNIKFLGFVNPDDIIPKTDVMIIPSLWNEPFGRVVIEAYSHNKPVIGANRGGIPEIIKENESGYVFDPDKPEQLQAIIVNILNNPGILNELSLSIPVFLEEFNNTKIVQKYVEIYDLYNRRDKK
ncbi:glycosyltransferase family 4 protein [Bacillus cereus]